MSNIQQNTLHNANGFVPVVGLNMDADKKSVSKGMYTYALNMVNNDNENIGILTNDNVFTEVLQLSGINDVRGVENIGNGKFVVFTTGSNSAIYLVNTIDKTSTFICYISNIINTPLNHIYTTSYNDDGNDIVYFSDGEHGIYSINITTLYEVDDNGYIVPTLASVPIFSPYKYDTGHVDILDYGKLPFGAYSIFIRFLDKNMNHTHWFEVKVGINIISQPLENNLISLYGDYFSGEDNDILSFQYSQSTNKSLKVTFDSSWINNSDSYEYIQIGIAVAKHNNRNNIEGFITDPISITTKNVIISNLYDLIEYDKNEFQYSRFALSGAKSLDIYENRLIIGNIKDNSKFYAKLQKIASRVIVNYSASNYVIYSNGVFLNRTSLMPGEVYALGLVFILDDGSESPVFHIPGRPQNTTQSNMDYYSVSSKYSSDNDYWGIDYEGNQLANQNIRFHKIPDNINADSISLIVGNINFTSDDLEEFADYADKIKAVKVVINKFDYPNRVVATGLAFPLVRYDDNGISNVAATTFSNGYDKVVDYSYIQILSPDIQIGNDITSFNKVVLLGKAGVTYAPTQYFEENVLDKSSANGLFFGLIKDDNDGADLVINAIHTNINPILTQTPTEYNVDKTFILSPGDSVFYKNVNVNNFSLDNKAYIIKTETSLPIISYSQTSDEVYYIALVNDNDKFQSLSSIVYQDASYNSEIIFDGTKYYANVISTKKFDTFKSIVRNTSTIYYETGVGPDGTDKRKLWETLSNIIAHQVVALVAAVITVAAAAAGQIGVAIAAAAIYFKQKFGVAVDVISLLTKKIDNNSNIKEGIRNLRAGTYSQESSDDQVLYQMSVITNSPFIFSRKQDAFRAKSGHLVSFWNAGYPDVYTYAKKKMLVYDKYRDPKVLSDGTKKPQILTLKPFPDPEIYTYNDDYNMQFSKVYMPHNYLTYINDSNYHKQRIYWSDNKSDEDIFDAMKVFRTANYKDINDLDGYITAIEHISNKLFVFTDKYVYYFPKPIQEKITSEFDIYIGTGQFLSIGPIKMIDDDNFGFGTIYPESILKLSNSLFYVSTNSIPVMLSNKFNNLAQKGMTKFFSHVNNFDISNGNIDVSIFKNISPFSKYGIGWITGYDPINKRVFFTQKDLLFNTQTNYILNNDGITFSTNPLYTGTNVSYSLLTNSFISLHSEKPGVYLWHDKGIGIIKNNSLYLLDKYRFNCKYVIEGIIPMKADMANIYEYINVNFDSSDIMTGKEINKFFTNVVFFNSFQNSGFSTIEVINNGFDINRLISNNDFTVFARRVENDFMINILRDFSNNTDNTFIYAEDKSEYTIFNYNSLVLNKRWDDVVPLRDTWLGIRLYNLCDENNTSTTIRSRINVVTSFETKSLK